jgi:hypothetical protein
MLKKKQIILSWIENYREITKKRCVFTFSTTEPPNIGTYFQTISLTQYLLISLRLDLMDTSIT